MPEPAESLMSADPAVLADALAFAPRLHGRKRTHNADENMAEIVAKRRRWPSSALHYVVSRIWG